MKVEPYEKTGDVKRGARMGVRELMAMSGCIKDEEDETMGGVNDIVVRNKTERDDGLGWKRECMYG